MMRLRVSIKHILTSHHHAISEPVNKRTNLLDLYGAWDGEIDTFYKNSLSADKGENDLNKHGYLLDTDVLIAFLRGKNPKLKTKVEEFLQQDIPLYMSMISLGEPYLGAFKSENPLKNLFVVNTLKEKIDLLNLTEDIVMLYGEIEAVLEKGGQAIGDFDVLIASTAITHDITLVEFSLEFLVLEVVLEDFRRRRLLGL